MLKTRVLTALILLAILIAVIASRSAPAFLLAVAAFQSAASWEAMRLAGSRRPLVLAAVWTVLFFAALFLLQAVQLQWLLGLCVLLWALRFAPALALGLPSVHSKAGALVGLTYTLSVLGCFIALALLFNVSGTYLLSVMVLVWVADVGAYFVGRATGKRKLAPSISPGKSWEGAFGGLACVLLVGAIAASVPALEETFPARLQQTWGWLGLTLAMVLLTAASVVGDLFESLLKRRAGMKDSSGLLPGHGGVLDRIDALVPVLPLAALVTASLQLG